MNDNLLVENVRERVSSLELAIIERCFMVADGRLLRSASESARSYTLARLNCALLTERKKRLVGEDAARCENTIIALSELADEAKSWLPRNELNRAANAVCAVVAGRHEQ